MANILNFKFSYFYHFISFYSVVLVWSFPLPLHITLH